MQLYKSHHDINDVDHKSYAKSTHLSIKSSDEVKGIKTKKLLRNQQEIANVLAVEQEVISKPYNDSVESLEN